MAIAGSIEQPASNPTAQPQLVFVQEQASSCYSVNAMLRNRLSEFRIAVVTNVQPIIGLIVDDFSPSSMLHMLGPRIRSHHWTRKCKSLLNEKKVPQRRITYSQTSDRKDRLNYFRGRTMITSVTGQCSRPLIEPWALFGVGSSGKGG